MININRGAEPPELTRERQTRLEEATKRFNHHGAGHHRLTRYLDQGYQVARPELWHRQHKKCAYCDRRYPYEGQPTEHFRPKKHALRNWREGVPEERDPERYWWLTWSWENLLFACTTCNSPANKGNRFPLVRNTEPLPAPTQPVAFPLAEVHFEFGSERPLLIDPADPAIDPLDHLYWRPVDPTLPRSLLQWTVRGMSAKGKVTKRILALEHRSDMINDAYQDIWRQFRANIDSQVGRKSSDALHAAWRKLTSDLIQNHLDFTAARWCMLNYLRTSTRALRKCELAEPPRPWRPPRGSEAQDGA